MSTPLHAVMAEFREHEALSRAVKASREAGYSRLEVYAPFPLRDLAASLGWAPRALPWIAAIAGAVGAVIQYGMQYWMNAVDYPLNVGGRPLHAWPTFIPATIIVAILWAGVATLLGMLIILRLPRLHHPVFAAHGFRRASQDRFFLAILGEDPRFDPQAVRAFLERLAPERVQEVAA